MQNGLMVSMDYIYIFDAPTYLSLSVWPWGQTFVCYVDLFMHWDSEMCFLLSLIISSKADRIITSQRSILDLLQNSTAGEMFM